MQYNRISLQLAIAHIQMRGCLVSVNINLEVRRKRSATPQRCSFHGCSPFNFQITVPNSSPAVYDQPEASYLPPYNHASTDLPSSIVRREERSEHEQITTFTPPFQR